MIVRIGSDQFLDMRDCRAVLPVNRQHSGKTKTRLDVQWNEFERLLQQGPGIGPAAGANQNVGQKLEPSGIGRAGRDYGAERGLRGLKAIFTQGGRRVMKRSIIGKDVFIVAWEAEQIAQRIPGFFIQRIETEGVKMGVGGSRDFTEFLQDQSELRPCG